MPIKKLKLFILTFAIIAGLLLTTCDTTGGGGGKNGGADNIGNNKSGNNIPMSEGTALRYFQDEGINIGWNLGNTLDAMNNGVAEETAWGNPLATQALLNGVKAQGFDIVRIPVTWSGHIGSAPDYTISSTRLNRVKTVVDYALNAGLKVIINVHHDDSPTDGWLKIWDAVTNTSRKNEITARYGRLWTQVAELFKNYDERLIFESMNEVQDGQQGGWGWSDAFRTPAGARKQMNIINEWNQLFTDNVRATGGYNAQRFLMYPSYGSIPDAILPDGSFGDPAWSAGNVGAMFKLPKDSAKGRQIITFHYYSPMEFAHNANETLTWGTPTEKKEVDALFARFKRQFVNKNYPVIIGEMGPVYQDNSTAQANRLAYISYVYKAAKDNGLIPVCWDDGGNFQILNRSNGSPMDSHRTQSVNAMMQAVGN